MDSVRYPTSPSLVNLDDGGVSGWTRCIEERDLERLLTHRNQESTRINLGTSRVIKDAEHRAWYESMRNDPTVAYRIAQVSSGAIDGSGEVPLDVGLIRVTEFNPVMGYACVGADIFEEYRGRGFGTKAFRAACKLAIKMGACRRLHLWVFSDNMRAMHIYQNEGFEIDPDEPAKTFIRHSIPKLYVKMVKRL